jgi:hypothetical protein
MAAIVSMNLFQKWLSNHRLVITGSWARIGAGHPWPGSVHEDRRGEF